MSEIIEENATLQKVICNDCKHKTGPFKCKAFDEIPDIIIFGKNDHSSVIEGQKGDFVFESVDNPRWIK